MAFYDIEALNELFEDFQKKARGLAVEIDPEENELDPLFALKCYQEARTTEQGVTLASELVRGKTVNFTRDKETVFSIKMNPEENILKQFSDKHGLLYLDTLISASYGLLLKKLTPPSNESTPPGSGSV